LQQTETQLNHIRPGKFGNLFIFLFIYVFKALPEKFTTMSFRTRTLTHSVKSQFANFL